MKEKLFDEIVAGIREDQPAAAVVEEAAARVRAGIFDGAGSEDGRALRACADFQALIPAWLARSLTPGRALLVEDHTRQCPACRQALDAARSGKVRTLPRPAAAPKPIPYGVKWAAAAALIVGAGLTTWTLLRSLIAPPGVAASVQIVNGRLYQISDRGSTPIFAGREIGDRQALRTAAGSTAVLRLPDGSLVELNERSELYLTRNASGAAIHLARGNVIVQAAKQKRGTLDVATADCLVSVKGTIFAVTRGVKGSRVSVIEGVVKVAANARSQELRPGDQVTTDPSIAKTAVADEVAWSRNSAQYLAILGEFSVLEKQVAAIPGPGLRYASKMVGLAPRDTFLYAAIPNIGSTLSEANRLFEDRLRQSETLREWWAKHQPAAGEPTLAEMAQKARAFSDYLGNEIVLSLSTGSDGRMVPAILAEVTHPGLREFVTAEYNQLSAAGKGPKLRLVESAAGLTKQTPQDLFVYVKNNVLAIAPEPAPIEEIAGAAEGSGRSGFEDSRLYSRVMQAYQSGAGWLFAADMEQIASGAVNRREMRRGMRAGKAAGAGFQDVRFMVLERREVGGKVENQASLSFSRERRGVASWLAAPGPMGSLDFVSPDASLAASFAIKNPRAMLADVMDSIREHANSAGEQGAGEQTATSQDDFRIVSDLAAPLGGDAAFAIDGGILPAPNWEFAVEVYNPGALQLAIEQALAKIGEQSGGKVKLTLTQTQANGRAYYTVRPDSGPFEADYTYVDSYLVVAANRNLLNKAIQNRATGYTLARSDKFRAQLPVDGRVNFSGILYHNLAPLIGPLAAGLNSTNALTPAQKASIEALQANSAPGLIYSYAEPDRIVAASTGSFFGLNLDTLALPKIFESAMRSQQQLQAPTQ